MKIINLAPTALILALAAASASAQDQLANSSGSAGAENDRPLLTCEELLAMAPDQALALAQGYVAGGLDALASHQAELAAAISDAAPATPATLPIAVSPAPPPGPSTEGPTSPTTPPDALQQQTTDAEPAMNPLLSSCMTGPDKTLTQAFADRFGQADPEDPLQEQEVPSAPSESASGSAPAIPTGAPPATAP